MDELKDTDTVMDVCLDKPWQWACMLLLLLLLWWVFIYLFFFSKRQEGRLSPWWWWCWRIMRAILRGFLGLQCTNSLLYSVLVSMRWRRDAHILARACLHNRGRALLHSITCPDKAEAATVAAPYLLNITATTCVLSISPHCSIVETA